MVISRTLVTVRALVCIALTLLLSIHAKAQVPMMVLEDGKVWTKNLNEEVLYTFKRYFHTQQDWENVFPVSKAENVDGIVIAGNYEISSTAVSFTPRFPFAINVSYSAKFFTEQLAHNSNEVYLPSMDANTLTLNFRLSPEGRELPIVTAVYPTAETLPENLLKFHIAFSKSMTRGEIYSRVKLCSAEGMTIDKAFLIVDQEFWDDEMKTVTLLFDPGRLKRGLRPNLEMKPALEQSKRYTLVIYEGWTDIDGLATPHRFTKSFSVVGADRVSPAVANYEIIKPADDGAPLIINFKEPMDFILLAQAIEVRDHNGLPIPGSMEIKNSESAIEFVPKNPWSESRYSILFNPLTEDLAGNNFKRLFDNDLANPMPSRTQKTQLNFTISHKCQPVK